MQWFKHPSVLFVSAFLLFIVAYAFLNNGFVVAKNTATQDQLVYFQALSVNPVWYTSIFSWIGLALFGLCVACFGLSVYTGINSLNFGKEVYVQAQEKRDMQKTIADLQFAIIVFTLISATSLGVNAVFASMYGKLGGIVGFILGLLVSSLTIFAYLKIKKRKQK